MLTFNSQLLDSSKSKSNCNIYIFKLAANAKQTGDAD